MKKTYTMMNLATALDGKLIGDGTVLVDAVAHPSQKLREKDLALAMDAALVPLLAANMARAAVVVEGAEIPSSVKAAVIVGRSRMALAKLNSLFEEKIEIARGVHPTAILENGVVLGENVSVGAMSYVATGTHIGDGCVIHPQVYIGPQVRIGAHGLIHSGVRIGARVKIGARCIIHFNATIGADGFSFVTPERGSVEAAKATGEIGDASNVSLVRIASLGAVEIGDDVEIGANTSIDRGTIVSTRIGNGTKIDNQVQIGHNVNIGENCMLCGRVGVAGSVVIGDRVVLGGAAGVADHVKIGEDSVVMGMSGVSSNLPPRSLVGGAPAKPRKKLIEDKFNLNRVKSLSRKIDALSYALAARDRKEGE